MVEYLQQPNSELHITEQGEKHPVPDLDIAIVFGQGPVKPVLTPSELTQAQKERWSSFRADPLRTTEPDFHVVEAQAFLTELTNIDNGDFTEAEKILMKARVRNEWQHMGRFALNLRCRQIALAAGSALVSGKTKELILTGGTTLPAWKKEEYKDSFLDTDPELVNLPKLAFDTKFEQYIKYSVMWPSEAELMADVIRRNFAGSYKAKHGKEIDSAMRVESDASNTLENIVLSINKNPEIIDNGKKIGILAFDPHVQRAAKIASLYGILADPQDNLFAQQILIDRAKTHNQKQYKEALESYIDADNNLLIQEFNENEDRLLTGLTETSFLAYWIGYTFGLNDPRLINNVMLPLLKDPAIFDAIKEVFSRVGQDLDEYTNTDLVNLASSNPDGYTELRHRLMLLNTPEIRPILPSLHEMKTWDVNNILKKE